MIITCDTCSTKFNLDETRIKPTGSKVRCSVCRTLFTAFPPESTERDDIETSEEKAARMEEPSDHEEKEAGKAPGAESMPALEGIEDFDHEFDIDESEQEDLTEPDTEPAPLPPTAGEPDAEEPEASLSTYQLEIDRELEEEILALEKEDQEIEPGPPEPEVPEEPEEPVEEEAEAGTDMTPQPLAEFRETEIEFDFEDDPFTQEEPEEIADLDLGSGEEFSFDREEQSREPDVDESPDTDSFESVPDEPKETMENLDLDPDADLVSLEPEDSVETKTGPDAGDAVSPEKPGETDAEFNFEEESFEQEIQEKKADTDIEIGDEFSLDDEEDDLDLDLEEFETQEEENEPEFDLDLDDETLELGMEDLEANEEDDVDTGEEEVAEFDFMAGADESFELEIDSDLDGETEKETFQFKEETDFAHDREKSAEPEKQSELGPPELEIGEFDLADADEVDTDPNDETGSEVSEEFEFELEDEQEIDFGGGLEFEEETDSEVTPAEEEAEEFDLTLYDESLDDEFEEEEDEETWIEEDTAEEEEPVKEAGTAPGSRSRIEKPPVPDFMDKDLAKKPSGLSKFFKFLLSFLVIAVILVAGYSTSIIMGIEVPYLSSLKIPFIDSTLQKYQSRPEPVNIVLDNQSINGRFASNKAEGKLFIITGRAANKSAFPVSQLRVEGTLITKGDVTARTKQVYCGNMIPEETLKNAEIDAIDRILTKKSGEKGANENIRSNGSIPFMIVFSNLPDNLENFSVKMAGHSRPGQEN